MSKYAYAATFIFGGVVGAVAMRLWMTRKTTDTPEETEKEQVLAMVKEELQNTEEPVIEGELVDEVDKAEYIKLVDRYTPVKSTEEGECAPYVISPMEFGDFEDYQAISLTYTADGVLLDDAFDPVEDIEKTVGKDYAKHFGAYPDDPDIVYIRNDALCSDFEICKDLRTAADFHKEKPHMRWRDNE